MHLHNTPAMKRLRGDKGFTLVELLVVIVIIGILVAIAVPIFLNQREAAQKRAVESDVRNAIPVMETYYSEHGDYGDEDAATLDQLEITTSDGVSLDIEVENAGQSYTIEGTHSALEGDGQVNYNSTQGGSVKWTDNSEMETDGE